MSFLLPEEPRPSNLPALDEPTPEWSDRFSASRQRQKILLDSWNHAQSLESDLIGELVEATGIGRKIPLRGRHAPTSHAIRGYLRTRALDAVAGGRARDPSGPMAHLPSTLEEFRAEVLRRRKAELSDADLLLGRAAADAWGAELLGSLSADATDEMTLITLPFGGMGRGVAAVAATEAGLNVAAELMTLPRQYEVADDLDVEPPNPLLQLGAAAVIGGTLGGAMELGVRAIGGPRPTGVSQVDHVARATEAEARLREELGAGADDRRRPEDVSIEFDLDGKIRDQPLSDRYIADLRTVVAPLGRNIGVRVVSGGQAPIGSGGRRTGSTRHDVDHTGHAHTADLVLTRDGKPVLPGDDPELYASFLQRAASVFPGLGHYRWGVHVGGGSVAAWGPSKTAATLDPLFGEAIAAGRAGRTDWTPPPAEAGAPVQGFTTRAGYTRAGSVTAGDGFRVDVQYEVVDASILRQARGDLQPRDRSRAQSDEQITSIAAGLDPARLLPAAEADRGAPIVGPDNTIESGNGRVMAIQRVYEQGTDRGDAYRAAIEEAGFEIPEGISEPVLIARRMSELDEAGRREFVGLANTSSTARMSATERARVAADAFNDDLLSVFDPAQPLNARANRAFVRRALDAMPQAERSAFTSADGRLNADGTRAIRQAMFARAYDAPDILARFAETDAGLFQSLIDALDKAAPEWAALRSAIAAGAVRPEMDITAYVLDAIRLIVNARDLASIEGLPVARAIDELLADIDLLKGAVDPLTAALVSKFRKGDRLASADEIAAFLARYATEARKIGDTAPSLLGDAPGPADVLKAIDGKAFGAIEEIRPRVTSEPEADMTAAELPETAYDAGATSPEAEAADLAALEADAPTARSDPDAAPAEDLRVDPELAGLEIEMPDGTTWRGDELIADIQADIQLADVIDACRIGGANA